MELETLIVPLVLDSSKYVANMNGAKSTTTSTVGGMKSSLSSLGLSGVASFLSISGAIVGVVAGIKAVVTETLAYGDEVRKMSLLNGTTAEETSRLIQLTGDYEIKQGELELASKQLAKNGISLSVSALQDLSTEFLNIKDPADRQAWLMKTFGARGGDAFVALMSAGADEIGRQNDEINTNLILTQDQLDQQLLLKGSLKELNDQWEGVKIALGTMLIPELVKILESVNRGIQAWQFIFSEMDKYTGGNRFLTSKVSPSVPDYAHHASGTSGWMTVPGGYPNDSYTVGMTSGETYAVNPGGGGGMDTAAVIKAINANKIDELKLGRAIRDAVLVAMG